MTSRRRRREEIRQLIVGGFLFLLLIVAAVTTVVFIYRAEADHPAVDATGCPREGPRAVHAIMLDATDAIGDVTRQQLRDAMLRQARSVERFGAFEIYVAGADPSRLLKPVFMRCSPGDPAKVSAVADNPTFAREEFDANYMKPIEQAIDKVLVFDTADRSPIMEGLQAVSVAAFPSGDEKLPRSLVIVSDMLQNSEQYSVYRGFSIETASSAARYYHASLQDVDVEILRIPRKRDIALQLDPQFTAFWTTWLAESGARLQSITPLQGMN